MIRFIEECFVYDRISVVLIFNDYHQHQIELVEDNLIIKHDMFTPLDSVGCQVGTGHRFESVKL